MMAASPPSAADDAPGLKPGDVVAGRFRIVDVIGSGGFSVVYRAHQEGMNRFVALKVLKPKASADEKIVERFRREALFASQLSHPNTITLFDYGQTSDDLCYIAMEYLQGTDLSEIVKYGEPVELKRVWSILSQTCQSLAEAHRIGLIHRDLKPENIFLVERNEGEQVKVLDFGVSKALSTFGAPNVSSLAPLTLEGTVFGTPLYMAPEQAMAEELTPAVDIYALGQMAYEMISGRAAYADETSAMDVMLRQVNDPPLELPKPHDDSPFSDLIQRCTAKDPTERIPDASRMLEVLMSQPFLPYMDAGSRPLGLRHNQDSGPATHLPLSYESIDPEAAERAEEVYRWELSILEEVLDEVRKSAEMRLVVIRGKPGIGRSNLLRAFLQRYRNRSGVRIVHRQAFADATAPGAGLEADLAEAASLSLEGEGISEVNRLLSEFLSDPELTTLSDLEPVRIDSNPLQLLTSRREEFFARLIDPFRKAARVGTLIWGIENLETVDPLTLAFLERLLREMRVHPSPILLAVTTWPDALVRRPGLMRYAEEIIHAPSNFARHIRLVEPKLDAEHESGESGLRGLAELSSDIDVGGSYTGIKPRVPEDFDFDDAEVERWAALADGVGQEEESTETERKGAVARTTEEREAYLAARSAQTRPTQKLEVFTTAEHATADFDTADPDIHQAFDTVLGYLAQLDERVVSRELWGYVYHRVLPFEMTRVMSVVLEYAERFGIITLSDDYIAFTDQEYTATLRQTFDELDSAVEAHGELAALLQDYSSKPSREDIRRIVHHSVKGEDYERAVNLLLRAGDSAYEQMDLDLAREYYLRFQSLIEELSTRSPTPTVAYSPYPRIWLRLGEIHGALGEYGAAEDALNRANREADADDHRLRAAAHKLLADLAMAQNRYEDAHDDYLQARDLYRQTALARPYVASLGEIGRSAMLLGQPRKAEGILAEAIDKAEKLEDLILAGRLHRYLGEVLTRQARFLEAIDHMEAAMAIFEDQDDHRGVVECLEQLGTAHFAAGMYGQSREDYTRALAVLSNRHLEADQSPHLGLARALAGLENLEQAEIHLVEAMSHYSTRTRRVSRARVQLHLGDLYLAMNRPKLADEHYAHVFEQMRDIGRPNLAVDALIRRGYANYDAGDVNAAYERLTEAADFASRLDHAELQRCVRAHIIYLQLFAHGFRARGDTFSSLRMESDDASLHRSHLLCDLFRADVATARRDYREAARLLTRTRRNAAGLGEYGLFIPIARRRFVVDNKLGRLGDPQLGSGYALGALVPPRSSKRDS